MFYHDVGGCFNALYRVHPILLIKIFLLLLLLIVKFGSNSLGYIAIIKFVSLFRIMYPFLQVPFCIYSIRPLCYAEYMCRVVKYRPTSNLTIVNALNIYVPTWVDVEFVLPILLLCSNALK